MVSTSICKPTYGLGLSLDAMVCFNVTDTDHFSQQSSPPSNLRSHSTARFTTTTTTTITTTIRAV